MPRIFVLCPATCLMILVKNFDQLSSLISCFPQSFYTTPVLSAFSSHDPEEPYSITALGRTAKDRANQSALFEARLPWPGLIHLVLRTDALRRALRGGSGLYGNRSQVKLHQKASLTSTSSILGISLGRLAEPAAPHWTSLCMERPGR